MSSGILLLCPEDKHFKYEGSYSTPVAKFMGLGIDFCTENYNLLKEGEKCAERPEIEKWVDSNMLFTWVANDVIDFSIRDGLKPTFQNFYIKTITGLDSKKYQVISNFMRKNIIETYDTFVNPFGIPTLEENFYDIPEIGGYENKVFRSDYSDQFYHEAFY